MTMEIKNFTTDIYINYPFMCTVEKRKDDSISTIKLSQGYDQFFKVYSVDDFGKLKSIVDAVAEEIGFDGDKNEK
jgi:hypothetical protein